MNDESAPAGPAAPAGSAEPGHAQREYTEAALGDHPYMRPIRNAVTDPSAIAGPGVVRVLSMADEHGHEVLAIYQAGIDEGNATFEVRAPSWDEFSAGRIAAHRYVAMDAVTGAVLGWVAISATSGRPVYAGVVEHSVYVHRGARGRGVGRLLLSTLIESTEAAGIWTIQSGVFPENTASIALHQSVGFRIVGRRERLGQQHGRWRDILLLERRSPAV
jgi:L-amino acid N-acyltransferase YncA